MDTDLPPSDDASRFATLHEESLKLLDAARSLVVEMRDSLAECRRRRPTVNAPKDDRSNYPAVRSRLEKSRRGGRVSKKGRLRRPR